MDAGVGRELGMERDREEVPLAGGDRVPPVRGEDLDVGAGALDPRGPDEHSREPVSYTHLRAHETNDLISYAVFCL